jgi:hypothetical protein
MRFCQQVDTAHIREPSQVDQHVSDLISEASPCLGIRKMIGYLAVGNPLQLRYEFSDLVCKGGARLRGV